MREITFPKTGLTVYREELENGLTVWLMPRPGFRQTVGYFTTHYGSVDNSFRKQGASEWTKVPDGIAHFLEHKLFEMEHGDVMSLFAANGAYVNAFTSFDQTTYYFSSTDKVLENLGILLDFVQNPYITEAGVEKEKGIIGQEIRMGQDEPDTRGYYGLLRSLFANHPITIDIAGTEESIAKITRDTLVHCHQTFYHPGNMTLVVVGGFDVNEVARFVTKNQAAKDFSPPFVIERDLPEEPAALAVPKQVLHLSVSQPRALFGWKDAKTGLSGRALMRQELETGIALDALFGRSSSFYHELLQAGLIEDEFGWEYEVAESYGYTMLGGSTGDPERLRSEVEKVIANANQRGLEREVFERSRRKAIGRFMASLDSPAHAARALTAYSLREAQWLDELDVLEALSFDEANQRIKTHLRPEDMGMCVVLPNAKD